MRKPCRLVAVLILLAAAARGEELPKCPPTKLPGCYVEQRRTIERTILNACLTETKCVTEVEQKKGYTVKTKDIATEVPFTRLVPVCRTDPRTGRTWTEMQPQTAMQKATTTYIVVLPPECPLTTKKTEERKRLSLQVTVGHAAAEVVEKVPVRSSERGTPAH
jgi:hypothetical protein